MSIKPVLFILFGFLVGLPNGAFAKDKYAARYSPDSLFRLGQEFAAASQEPNNEAAQLIFKKAMKAIQKTQTPIEKFEDWMNKKHKFSSMLVEAFTVAVAITASEIFLHPENNSIQTADAVNTILGSVGVVGGGYMPYHWLSEHLKKKQNRELFEAFFLGMNSILPQPIEKEDLTPWLLNIVGPSKAMNSCRDYLK